MKHEDHPNPPAHTLCLTQTTNTRPLSPFETARVATLPDEQERQLAKMRLLPPLQSELSTLKLRADGISPEAVLLTFSLTAKPGMEYKVRGLLEDVCKAAEKDKDVLSCVANQDGEGRVDFMMLQVREMGRERGWLETLRVAENALRAAHSGKPGSQLRRKIGSERAVTMSATRPPGERVSRNERLGTSFSLAKPRWSAQTALFARLSAQTRCSDPSYPSYHRLGTLLSLAQCSLCSDCVCGELIARFSDTKERR